MVQRHIPNGGLRMPHKQASCLSIGPKQSWLVIKITKEKTPDQKIVIKNGHITLVKKSFFDRLTERVCPCIKK